MNSRCFSARRAIRSPHDALLELKKYTKVTLITNTDNDIIKESVKQIGVEFDDIVTAEMAGAYKPSHKGFYLSQKRLGLTEKDILHEGRRRIHRRFGTGSCYQRYGKEYGQRSDHLRLREPDTGDIPG